MTRHSKNNTNAAVFSNAERAQLKGMYGTRMARLEASSQREYDSCGLCLKTAVNPVICEHGHLFCKECILEYLLREKQRIREEKIKVEEKSRLEALRKQEQEEAEYLRRLESFRAQNGLVSIEIPTPPASSVQEIKPSVQEIKQAVQLGVQCPLGNHAVALKRLHDVKLTKECPACRNNFHRGSEILVNLPCGDLCCKECKSNDNQYCPICSESIFKVVKLFMEREKTVKESLSPAPLFS